MDANDLVSRFRGAAGMVGDIGDLRDKIAAERAHPRTVVDELRRLDADGSKSHGQFRRYGGKRLVQIGDLVGTVKDAAGAAHVLDLGRAPPGRDQRPREPRQSPSLGRPSGLKPLPCRTRRLITRLCTVEPPNQSAGPPGRNGCGSTHTSLNW